MHSIITSLNYELGKLIIWLNANKLSINVSKHITWCFTVQDEK